jgi:lipoyl-dependent peroxiredoxin
MEIKRSAVSVWNGSGKDGKGVTTTDSGVLNNIQYSFKTRFEDGIGTNPEELIAAAHSGCFSMKLAFVMQAASITPDSIETKATVVLGDAGIADIYLHTAVKVAGVTKEQLETMTLDAKENCPISKLFNAKIHLETVLL